MLNLDSNRKAEVSKELHAPMTVFQVIKVPHPVLQVYRRPRRPSNNRLSARELAALYLQVMERPRNYLDALVEEFIADFTNKPVPLQHSSSQYAQPQPVRQFNVRDTVGYVILTFNFSFYASVTLLFFTSVVTFLFASPPFVYRHF